MRERDKVEIRILIGRLAAAVIIKNNEKIIQSLDSLDSYLPAKPKDPRTGKIRKNLMAVKNLFKT
jgi:hypothetical protein